MRNCGRCHTCGEKLQSVLDGEEYCRKCGVCRRYYSHGWAKVLSEEPCSSCPDHAEQENKQNEPK